MRHIATVVLQPLFLCIFAMGVGLVWRWWRRTDKRRVLIFATLVFAGLWLSCTTIVAHLALGALEWRYVPSRPLSDRPGAIVVLSASWQKRSYESKDVDLDGDTYYRCLHALQLYREHGQPLIVVSGGIDNSHPDLPPIAQVMRDYLVHEGVRPEQVLVEPRAEDTHENAVESCRLLRQRGVEHVVVVTDACHMPRAVGCFRHEGMEVEPAPCNFRTASFKNSWACYVPTPNGPKQLEAAVHEWVGLGYYWLRGWI
jgi:uncharacterized SAM-binding protein YcdF (DUF218 family)